MCLLLWHGRCYDPIWNKSIVFIVAWIWLRFLKFLLITFNHFCRLYRLITSDFTYVINISVHVSCRQHCKIRIFNLHQWIMNLNRDTFIWINNVASSSAESLGRLKILNYFTVFNLEYEILIFLENNVMNEMGLCWHFNFKFSIKWGVIDE